MRQAAKHLLQRTGARPLAVYGREAAKLELRVAQQTGQLQFTLYQIEPSGYAVSIDCIYAPHGRSWYHAERCSTLECVATILEDIDPVGDDGPAINEDASVAGILSAAAARAWLANCLMVDYRHGVGLFLHLLYVRFSRSNGQTSD